MTDQVLLQQLHRDEGERLKAYKDTLGNWTIGYGHLEDQQHIVWEETQVQADQDLASDIARLTGQLVSRLPWVTKLSAPRLRVLENMVFNMGIARLLTFKNTLAFIQQEDYTQAASNMLASKWAQQVGARANRLAQQMETGIDV